MPLAGTLDRFQEVGPAAASRSGGENLRDDVGQRRTAQVGHANQGETGQGMGLDGQDRHDVRMVQPAQPRGFLVGLDADLDDDLAIPQGLLPGQKHPGEAPPADFAHEGKAGDLLSRLRPGRRRIGREGVRMVLEILVNLQQLSSSDSATAGKRCANSRGSAGSPASSRRQNSS